MRYYDRIGLVSPRVRTDAGYRLYDVEEEGKLRFVRQAKSLGFSLDDIRELISAAERGCCGEVVPELDRLLDQKVAEVDAQLTELTGFRERLVAFRAGRGASCGCSGHRAFCGCLDGAGSPGHPETSDERRPVMNKDTTLALAGGGCGCSGAAGGGGCGCGCDGRCGCDDAAAGSTSVEQQISELEQAKRDIDRRLAELHQA